MLPGIKCFHGTFNMKKKSYKNVLMHNTDTSLEDLWGYMTPKHDEGVFNYHKLWVL